MNKKELLVIFIPIALLVGGFTAAFYYADSRSEHNVSKDTEAKVIQGQAAIITSEFGLLKSDLATLAAQREVERFFAYGETQALERYYDFFLKQKRMYQWLVLLDRSGEIVVESPRGRAQPIPQRKGTPGSLVSVEFVAATMSLDAGEVGFTLYDSSTPGAGRIFVLSMPVADANGNNLGALALGYRSDILHKKLTQASVVSFGAQITLDAGGSQVFSVSPETGAQTEVFPTVFSSEWEKIANAESGQLMTRAGMFTFATVRPLGPPDASKKSAATFGPPAWKLVSFVPHDLLHTASRNLWGRLLLLFATLVLLLALALRYLDRVINRQSGLPTKGISPFTMLVITTALIFFSELAVMKLIDLMPPLPMIIEALIDAALLSVLLIPMLSFFIFRPVARHISEHRIVEESLANSEKNVRAIIKSVGEGIVVVDSKSTIQMVNGELLSIFGYAENELIGKKVSVLMPAKLRDKHETGMHSYLGGGRPRMLGRRVELEGIRKSGEAFPIELRVEETSDVTGERFFTGAIRDISERKAAERALKESERKYRAIINSTKEGYIRINNDNVIVEVNHAFCSILGYARQDIVGSSPLDFVTAASKNKLEEQISKIAATEHRKYEVTLMRKDGANVYAIVNGATIRDIDGDVAGAFAFITDITELKDAQEELRKSEDLFRAITTSARNAIVMIDEYGNTLVWNPEAERVFGFSEEEVIGKNIGDFVVPPEFREDHKAGMDRFRTTGQGPFVNNVVELTGVRRNGQRFPMELSIAAVRRGDVYRAVGMVQDITDRKETEKAFLLAKEKAEEATRLKDKFVSLVAHDLRAPFTSIVSLLKLVKSDKEHPLSDKQMEIISHVLKSGEHSLEMIEELLNVTRLQTGTLMPRPVFFEARLIVMEVLGSLGHMAQKKSIIITNDVPERARLYADPNLFKEVLFNLVSNAVKFSRTGGAISVFIPDGARSTIAVRDSGIGVDPKTIPNIFKYEEKTSTEGTAGEPGTGLGLPLSYDIMKAHGGDLRVEPIREGGTVFCATLPEVKPRILIVEDEKISSMKISRMLADEDLDISTAANGMEALDTLKNESCHLVLTDLFMPVMDGFTFISQIKADPALKTIPVIAITAHTDYKTRETALQLGADDFVAKPIVEEELIHRIKKYIP